MFSTSKCAQEQQLSIDVGVDLWLYAGLSRNVHRKGLSIFSGSKRSILCVHLFDKYWYSLWAKWYWMSSSLSSLPVVWIVIVVHIMQLQCERWRSTNTKHTFHEIQTCVYVPLNWKARADTAYDHKDIDDHILSCTTYNCTTQKVLVQ